MAKKRCLLLQISLIVDVRLGSKYTFGTRRLLTQTPLRARLGSGTQQRYEALGDFRVENRRKSSDKRRVSEIVPSTVVQRWPWDTQTANEKGLPLQLLCERSFQFHLLEKTFL